MSETRLHVYVWFFCVMVCSYANVAVLKILPSPGPIGLDYSFFLQEREGRGGEGGPKLEGRLGWKGKGG